MVEYNKRLPNGLWIARRDGMYYVYEKLKDIQRDDAEANLNIERFKNGTPIFKRDYDGCWVWRYSKLSYAKKKGNYYVCPL